MNSRKKQLSNPCSTGGLGIHFENRVQASFVVLMLAEGFAPCLPTWPISKIKLQGKYQGFNTDDLIVYVTQPGVDKQAKLLAQIKHSIKFTENNSDFEEVIQAAWHDFNNKDVFCEGVDNIALICGPLSANDTDSVRSLLRQAKESESAEDFLKRIELAKFTSNQQRDKYKIFKSQLKKANNGEEIAEKETWRFLKSFHLLIYDLDIKGIVLSLLHSLIGQYSQDNPHALWTQMQDEVERANENAGFISRDSITEAISSIFQKKVKEVIPGELVKMSIPSFDWNQHTHSSQLAIVNLIGSWNEKSDADVAIIAQLAKENYTTWIPKVREVLQVSESPIALKNGVWSIIKRDDLWQKLGSRIFDTDLDMFKQCAITVLSERDPRFDLKPNERYAASIHGKVLKHSHFIREGFAESLALLGSYPNVFTNCSLQKAETVAVLAIREIFIKADWILWGSLNHLLPLLAEAAPVEFMEAVEKALLQVPCPFDELFAQEGKGVMGENYITGLLWALEGLAWDEQYLARVSVILGELALHDPGGNWANRPANSLTTIFLPWLPQTIASIEKRKVAIKTLQKENPEKAWELLINLLPNQQQVSSGSHKPRWRKVIPGDWSRTVSNKDYWEQISSYTDTAVEMARNDIARLNQLIKYLDHLTPESFSKILGYLSSKEVIDKPENQRAKLWEELIAFISRHKKYADAKWAMKPELISKIEDIAKKLAPTNPYELYHRLFSGRDFELYEEKGDWQEQQKKLEEERQKGIKEVFDFGGTDAVFNFAKMVESPWNVGFSFGHLTLNEIDLAILPRLLDQNDKKLSQFASGFVWAKYWSYRWDWVDKIKLDTWSLPQIGQFLAYLPFINGSWERVEKLLKENDAEYWNKVNVDPYREKDNLNFAIDKLIKVNRPNSAINCLNRILHDKQPLNKSLVVRALLAAISTKESHRSTDTYDIVELIKVLQNDPETNIDDLFKIEWAYLPILNEHSGGSPKTLEKYLASDYKFFCEIIRLLYRSDKKEKSSNEPTKEQRAIATNAYQLLREWRIPPGLQPNGTFSDDHFKKWLDSVKKDCSESGHLYPALSSLGKVIIYTPPDPGGLWINKTVADALNSKDAEAILNGYRMGIYNSRGVHWVDPMGKPELELSAKYNNLANEIENAGYHRFAAMLRGLADSYDREAKRIIEEHKNEESSGE